MLSRGIAAIYIKSPPLGGTVRFLSVQVVPPGVILSEAKDL